MAMKRSPSSIWKKDRSPGESSSPDTCPEADKPTQAVPFDRLEAISRLSSVIDPELGINIVDLGLIYDLQAEDGVLTVALTMTTPACPMGNYIRQQAARALKGLPGIRKIVIEQVWEPAWSPLMVSPEGRSGLFPSYG